MVGYMHMDGWIWMDGYGWMDMDGWIWMDGYGWMVGLIGGVPGRVFLFDKAIPGDCARSCWLCYRPTAQGVQFLGNARAVYASIASFLYILSSKTQL